MCAKINPDSNYGAIWYRLRDIVSYWPNLAKVLYPTGHWYLAPSIGGNSVKILQRCLIFLKLELLGYCAMKKM